MRVYLLLILLSLITIFSGCIEDENNGDDQKLTNDLNPEGKTVVIVFYADWCKYCKALEPTLNQLEKEGIEIIRINVDEHPELAQKFGVRGLPTVIYIKNGFEVGRTVGYDPKEVVNKARELYE
ncbi:thiol reductase thioredoxin [Methanofervidicoccus sp. A16]|uniref:thioredoxin family protein n=1 Tax=Methanofervidicoccus sp. A16 TaxID=2607662 RepID=UPI00118B5BCC|nr:thioredoxin family protein [Methanofervidicoccus sp. A16]AXI24836.1 thiol reductase thioredoxin [Methanofervidicoccus sp. A16]MBW9220554.1 thioredoxin family protein [Methanothermococcus sp. SCGC AD-155-N22]